MRRRAAILLLCALVCLCGCERAGTLAFTLDAEESAESGGEDYVQTNAAALGAEEFSQAFAALIGQSGRNLSALSGEDANERAYRIDDVSIEAEYADGFELHVFAPGGETESVTLTMHLPALKSEDDVPSGDAAARLAVQEYNGARQRERAAFMECVESALRAANKYKNSFSEADVLTALSDTEKTVKRGSEQSEELPGAISRSFLLDVGYTPQIVFALEFIM